MNEKEDTAFVERFTVRMPDGMRDAIAERARDNGRSMNSEIVQILDNALNGGITSVIDEAFLNVFHQVGHSRYQTLEEFNDVNEKVDWLMGESMERLDNISRIVRILIEAKKDLYNKKPT